MALTAAGLLPLVLADYVSVFPGAATVVRSNTSTGVVPHSPPTELVSAICSGFATALTSMVVRDAYTGVSGSGQAIAKQVTPVFNPGTVTNATNTFIATMQWTGTNSLSLANVLISSFFVRVASITRIAMPPLTGAGAGAGVVSLAINPTLATAMTAAASSAILSAFTSSGYFAIGDVPGNAATPQIAALSSALSVAYGSVVGSVTAATVYTGPATTGPLLLTNSGKFV